MSQPYDRLYNFSAGPSTLPVEVLEQARDEMLNWHGAGMGVMEMSHRGKAFESIIAKTESDFRLLVGIPENYKVLFLQGGASLQFTMIPKNLLGDGSSDYVVTGAWGKLAFSAAQIEGCANKVYDSKDTNYDRAPDLGALKCTPDASYLHFTSNETIQGVDFLKDYELSQTVVCDMSSNILSRPVDVSKYGVIYAGAQKNMGPSGVAVVVIREDLLDRSPEGIAPMLSYKVAATNGSMYNTPPTWGIYICGLVYEFLLRNGGLDAQLRRNEAKSGVVYAAIDRSNGFYKAHAVKENRSLMNVTFTLGTDELTEKFLAGAKAMRMDGLKGHRSVGGVRASIYNAFPLEGCQTLASYMDEFASKNG